MNNNYGFVYIWYDTKLKRFYIGSHWNNKKNPETDGYICSSKTMRDNYRNRPNTFKRRILKRVYTNRNDLLLEEQKWLDLIPKEDFGKRYYNKSKNVFYPHIVFTKEQEKIRNELFKKNCVGWNKGLTKNTHPQLAKTDIVRQKISVAQKGIAKGYTGRKFYNDGVTQIMCDPNNVPSGWLPGRLNCAWNKGKKGSVPWNKGKTCPQLAKFGAKNGMFGRKQSKELIQKRKESLIRTWNNKTDKRNYYSSKKVIVDGIEYISFSEANRQLQACFAFGSLSKKYNTINFIIKKCNKKRKLIPL